MIQCRPAQSASWPPNVSRLAAQNIAPEKSNRPDRARRGSRIVRADVSSRVRFFPRRVSRTCARRSRVTAETGRQCRDLGAETVSAEKNDHQDAGDHDRSERDAQQDDVDVALGGLDQHAAGRRPRRGGSRRMDAAALEPRLDGRRDNVALLNLLAHVGVADHLGHGLVGIDRDDRNLAQVFGARTDAVRGTAHGRRPARRQSRS